MPAIIAIDPITPACFKKSRRPVKTLFISPPNLDHCG
jgi:hypothetical protein